MYIGAGRDVWSGLGVFDVLCVSDEMKVQSFSLKDPTEWNDDPCYQEINKAASMKVVNDTAERSVALIRQYNSTLTTCAVNNLCALRHNMPPSLSSPRGRLGRRRRADATEQTQRSSTFPRRIRSHADRCSRLTRLGRAE